MANEVFKGLFGFSPDELTQQRQMENEARAFKLAQLNPLEQISFQGYNAASGIRDSVKDIGRSLFNIEDPQMRDSTVLDGAFQELVSSGGNPMSTQGIDFIISKAQQGKVSPQALERLLVAKNQVAQEEAKIGVNQSKMRENQAQAAIAEMNLQDRQKMAEVLSKLPADATDEQKMAAIMQFTRNPDVVIQGINQRQAAKERADANKQAIQMQIDARLEAARQAGANARELEAIRQEGRLQIEQMRQDGKKEAAEAKKYDGFVKAERAAEGFIDNSQNIIGRLEAVKNRINSKTAGLTGAALSKLWANEAQAVKLELESIGSNIGFDKLAEMRQNSPTGGALGSVSDYEGKQLRNAAASLENTQQPGVLRDNIQKVINDYKRSLDRIKNGLEQDRGKFRKGEQPSKTVTVDY